MPYGGSLSRPTMRANKGREEVIKEHVSIANSQSSSMDEFLM
jgi:hypothetical protein